MKEKKGLRTEMTIQATTVPTKVLPTRKTTIKPEQIITEYPTITRTDSPTETPIQTITNKSTTC